MLRMYLTAKIRPQIHDSVLQYGFLYPHLYRIEEYHAFQRPNRPDV